MSRICCAPLTHTRCQFVPNSHLLQPRSVSDTGRFVKAVWLHRDGPCVSCPSAVTTSCPVIRWYWSRSVSLFVQKRVCYFIFSSFTYLTAAVLSYVVFPFTLSSALTPAQQWIIITASPCLPPVSLAVLAFVCD